MTSTNKAKLQALLELINSAAYAAIAEYEKAGDDAPFIDSAEPHPLDAAPDQVALRSTIHILEGACATQLCSSLAPPSHTLNNLVQTFDHACIRVALKENITDILEDYPNGIHINELSKIVKIDPQKLARVLRLLATRGCYKEVHVDTFANNQLSLILHSQNPVRHIASMESETTVKGAVVLYETLKDPKTAFSYHPDHSPLMYHNNREGFTGSFFEWMGRQDTLRESFHQSMRAVDRITGSLAVLSQFPFEKYSTVVDVGGGISAFALPLAQMHKHIKISLQDLPDALVWAKEGPEAVRENRVEFVDFDFLTQLPVKDKDIYYVCNIIHNWPDEEAVIILRNIRQVLRPDSRVLIHKSTLHEHLLLDSRVDGIDDHILRGLSREQANNDATSLGAPVAPEPMLPNFGVSHIHMYEKDMTMWILQNAKERTFEGFLQLTNVAGLKLEKVWDLVETYILEFSPA